MNVEIKKFTKGAFIYLESNSDFREFYIIKKGQVLITKLNRFGTKTEETRSAGYIFGIVQCITGFGGNERALAMTDCDILIIRRDQISDMYNSHPKTILKIISEYSDILRKLDSKLLASTNLIESINRYERIFTLAKGYVQIKAPKKSAHLLQSFSKESDIPEQYRKKALELLSKLPKVDDKISDAVISDKTYEKGQVIFTENELGNTFYIIKSGKIRISKLQTLENKELTIAILEEGDIFGEMAIINDKPRNATATAEEPTTLMIIKKAGINNLPASLFLKILLLLTRRIWMVEQQLLCSMTENVLLKCYLYVLAKIRLKGLDPIKTPNKSTTLKLTVEEICDALMIDMRENSGALKDFQQDRNLVFVEDEIKIPKIGVVCDRCEYLSKMN